MPRTSPQRYAEDLIDAACTEHHIDRQQLHLHSDNGPAMTSKKVAQLLADLGVTRSLSRPHVSNDNPYSESHFKTLKHTHDSPDYFVSLAHARTFIDEFLDHYNQHHRHSGIGYHTPADVHAGRHHTIRAARQTVLDNASTANPHRFRQRPTAPQVPDITWINQPETNLSHTP